MDYHFSPIGIIRSCFKEKFGIPRQPGLASDARATLELLPPYDREEALRGLEQFSHLWVIFVFHGTMREQWKPTVRPPRLGGNQRLGVFATRSTFRPNPIGLSAVELEGWDREEGRLVLHLKGIDLMDGTPVLDIKPYLPYADNLVHASAGYAAEPPPARLEVVFTPEALTACQSREANGYPQLQRLIEQVLGADPRPAYYQGKPGKSSFGMRLLDFDLRWEMREGSLVCVTALLEHDPSASLA